MAERNSLPGLRGYEFDSDTTMPVSPMQLDVALFGENTGVDLAELDRKSETATHLGGAALLPEREYIVHTTAAPDVDPFDTYAEIQIERNALRKEVKDV